MRFLGLVSLIVLALPLLARAGDKPPVLVGVVEDRPLPGHADARRLRVAFRDQVSHWETPIPLMKDDTAASVQGRLAGITPTASWTVCARHKAVAHGTAAVLPTVERWPDLGVAALRPRGRLPWGGAAMLLATAGGRCDDPDGWKPAPTVSPRVLDRLVTPMGRVTNGFKLCRPDGTSVFYAPRAGELAVKQALRARDGRLLLVVAPHDPKLRGCSDRPASYYERLFLIDTRQEVHFLGASLRIIGAADLGGDGRSVVVAWQNDGKFQAYMLFSNDLMRSTRFWWPVSASVFDELRKD